MQKFAFRVASAIRGDRLLSPQNFSRFPSPDLGLGEPQRALALYGRKPGAEVKSPGSSPGPGDCH